MKLSTLVAGTGLTPSLRSVVGPFGVALQAKPIAPQCGYFCGSKPLMQALQFCPQKNQFLSKLDLLVAERLELSNLNLKDFLKISGFSLSFRKFE
jgi:hypothetical protein